MADPGFEDLDDSSVDAGSSDDLESDDAETSDDDTSGTETDSTEEHDSLAERYLQLLAAELADAEQRPRGMVTDEHVVPDSQFLPLAIDSDVEASSHTDVLACSYPTSQHDPGLIAELVSLQHWTDDSGQDRHSITAFLTRPSQSDKDRLTPIIQGTSELPSPFATVDRAGNLVAAGSESGIILVWQLHPDAAEGMQLVGSFTVGSPVNSVRFGMWAGDRRLIAACQWGQVLLLDAPRRTGPLTAEDLLLDSVSPKLEPCFVLVSQSLAQTGGPRSTAMLSLSKCFTGVGAIKSATPSPNGRWMAICPDKSSRVLIFSVDNKEPPFEFDIGRNYRPDIDLGDKPEESQYASWNATGTRLAVTSSGLAMFVVYDMNKRRVVHRLFDASHRNCFAVAWHPHNENIFVYASSRQTFNIVDVRCPHSYRGLRQPGYPRIQGFCISPDSRLWVASRTGLHAWQLLLPWSINTHKHWPPHFKAVVKVLLVGWSLARRQGKKAAGASEPAADADLALLETLQHLQGQDYDMLLEIFRNMAEPTGNWHKADPDWTPGWLVGNAECTDVYMRVSSSLYA